MDNETKRRDRIGKQANSKSSRLPRTRLARLAHLGGLAGKVAGGVLAEGLRQAARGNLPRAAMTESAQAIGYFREDIHARQRAAVIELFVLATEPARIRGRFDFGASDLAARIRDAGMALSFDQGYWHTPPADAIFLHRKLGGLYLLAARLRTKIDVRAILEPHLYKVIRATV